MGNGRWLGRTLGKSSETSRVWLRALGAMFVLMLASFGLLSLGSHRRVQDTLAPRPASPLPTSSSSSLKSKREARAVLGQLPLIFEPNQGQADLRAKFLARGAGYSLFLGTTGAVLGMQTAHTSLSDRSEQFVEMKLVGANPAAALTGADPLPGKTNYIVGNNPQKWHSDVPQFAGVRYASVYPGIDLIFYGNQGHLEYDFRVSPGADPSRAELQFDGASKLELSGGDLILTGKDDGGLRLHAPQVYQRDGDRREPVPGRFVLRAANRVAFEIGAYDHSRELVIDPVLNFSTYFGGSGAETSPSVAVNGDGNIYMVGSTTSPPLSFPIGTLGATAPTQLGTAPNIFVAKINPSQPPSLVYLTFLGGSGGPGADTSIGIGVDNAGDTYIVGNTSSPDFPTIGLPYQTGPETKTFCAAPPAPCTSVFVTELNPTGTSPLIYSTYLSGNGDDQASGMTIDNKGDVFVTGTTTSYQPDQPSTDEFPATVFPVPVQSTPKAIGLVQFFATQVNTRAASVGGISYSTYFGGGTPVPAIAIGGGIAVDTTGNMYFSGTTNFFNSGLGQFGNSSQSEDFPIVNAYQACLDTHPATLTPPVNNPCTLPPAPVPTDAFVAKINPLGAVGAQLLFSTYLGGLVNDSGTAIAVDAGAANIYLTGETNSSDFVIPTGTAPYQLCLDTPPVTPPVLTCTTVSSPTAPLPFDAYVARLSNPTQNGSGTPVDVTLNYFSYLGGSANDSGSAIAVLNSQSTVPLNDVVITGATSSKDFPVTITTTPPIITPIQPALNGTTNAFFAEINTTTVVSNNGVGSYVTYFGGNGVDHGTGIAVDPNLNSYLAGDTTSTNLQVDDPLQGAISTPPDDFVVKLGTLADLTVTCVVPCVSPVGNVSAGNQVVVTFTITNQGPDPATFIAVNGSVPANAGITFNSASVGSGTCSPPSSNGVVCQIPTLQVGSLTTVTFTVTPNGTCTSCSVTAAVSSSNDTNTGNTATASFVAGGYTVSITPPSQTVAAGLPANYSVNLFPQGVFPGNVTLSCSTLPTGASCSFSSSSVSLANGSQSVILALTTTAQPVTTIASAAWWRPLYALWLMFPGMALLGAGYGGKRRRDKRRKARVLGLLGLSVLFALILLQPSCSSTKTQPTVSGTPSGTYALTITAASGSFTQSQAFNLTVTP
ncbi:MAG TPA: SBBP repeat-containing protein [Candidatus Sulfotelmatobacter sp.]|nr:SBBP repeat-containing protein [Candidatus Sulfotelmatobacter sp.]